MCTASGPSTIRSVRACAQKLASGVSLLTPAPPCSWMARSMTSRATRGAATLIAEISVRAPFAPYLSIRSADVGEAQLGVAVLVLETEHRQVPDDLQTGGLPRNQDHRLLAVRRTLGVGL